MKDIVIIGGPNGAGKTTAASAVVPTHLGIREFVNADEIAHGLSPFNFEGAAVAAGRLMIERIRALVAARASPLKQLAQAALMRLGCKYARRRAGV